jgi:hypothetical protein
MMTDTNRDTDRTTGGEAFEETGDGKLRRRAAAHKLAQAPGERDGRDGPEPTRYGDWEKKGIISDF